MVDEERERNCDSVVGMELKGKEVNNGSVIEIENGVGLEGNSAGSSGDYFRTYSRRKRQKICSSSEDKFFEDGKVSTNSTGHPTDKVSGLFGFLQGIKEPQDTCFPSSSCNQVNLVRMDSHASRNGSEYCSVKDWRKIALEQMYQSLNESEGGLQECIRDALLFHPEGGCTSTIKESIHFGKEMHNGTQSASKEHVGVMSNGSTDESNFRTNTDLCKRALFDVLISTKFAELCDLLFGNFQGLKVNRLFDISMLNSRIKEGAYESSPMLFHSDIQQVWTKIEKVGTEMVSLAKSLSEKSRASCHDGVGDSVQSEDDKDQQFLMQESNGHAEVEQNERSRQYRTCTCRHCEEKTEGRECLVCDYCEEMYHVSCIGPDVQEIPLKSWCCSNCRAKGNGSPHENCVLCECLNARRSSGTEIPGILTNAEELELEESSDDLEEEGLVIGEESSRHCNICRNEVENEKFRLCGHSFCPNKYYHERCLTVKQLNTYGSCWYCPSCLCRRCLTDRDDDKIVLCDGCNQAFHIYCMQPPLATIPKGRWFCRKCDQGLQRLHNVKMAYSNRQYKLIKRAERGKVAYENLKNVHKEMGEDLLDKSGGVDMLLTAAKTLNYEENLAAQGFK